MRRANRKARKRQVLQRIKSNVLKTNSLRNLAWLDGAEKELTAMVKPWKLEEHDL